MGYPSPEYYDVMMEDFMEEIADQINNKIKDSDSIIHIFYILESLRKEDLYAINYLDDVLFLSELKKHENSNKYLFISCIIHPLLLKFPKIKEYTISKLKILSQEELKSFLLWILKKDEINLYFNNEYISPYYFEIFDCDEFSNLFKEIINQFNFKDLYSIIDFYISKKKDKHYIQENSMYINLKGRFTELSYPMLEDPNNHLDNYYFLEERYYQKHYIINNCYQQINELEILGYPFKNYHSKFRENIIRLIKENILIVEHDFIFPHF